MIRFFLLVITGMAAMWGMLQMIYLLGAAAAIGIFVFVMSIILVVVIAQFTWKG